MESECLTRFIKFILDGPKYLVPLIDGNGIYWRSSNDATGDKAYTALKYSEIDASYSEVVFSINYQTNSA